MGSAYKQNMEGKFGLDESIYSMQELWYIYGHEETIQLVLLLHSSQRPQQSEENK